MTKNRSSARTVARLPDRRMMRRMMPSRLRMVSRCHQPHFAGDDERSIAMTRRRALDTAHYFTMAELMAKLSGCSVHRIVRRGNKTGTNKVRQARIMAIYFTATLCDIPKRRLACVTHRSRTRIIRLLRDVEDRRSDDAFDLWCDAVEAYVVDGAPLPRGVPF